MNSELIAALDYFEREKGIKREILIEAVSNALLASVQEERRPRARSAHRHQPEIRRNPRAWPASSSSSACRTSSARFCSPTPARVKPEAQVGESVEIEVTPRDFGRISAQTAKQAMLQRIRSAEKEMMYDEFKDRAGEIVSGHGAALRTQRRDRGPG